jgi:hypothetical protein
MAAETEVKYENILQQSNQVQKYTDECQLRAEVIQLRGSHSRQSLLDAYTSKNEGRDPLLRDVSGENIMSSEPTQTMTKSPQAANMDDDRAELLARISALELENERLREKIDNPLVQSPGSVTTDASRNTNRGGRISYNGIRCTLLCSDHSDAPDEIAETKLVKTDDQGDDTKTMKGSVPFEDEGCTPFISDYEEKNNASGEDAAPRDNHVCFSLSECSRFKTFIDSARGEELATADSSEDHQIGLSQSLSAAALSGRSDLLDEEDASNTHKRSVSSFDAVRTKFTVSRAEELVTKLNVINHMLKKKPMRSFDGSAEQRQSFQQFFLLSVDPNVARDESDWVDAGSRFLDPVILRSADCIDFYPRDSKDGMSTNELSMFCLLGGLKVRLIPKAACYQSKPDDTNEYKVLAVSFGSY